MGSEHELRGDDLILGYGDTEIIHSVSVTLAPGRVTALVGPNGSGKSTLLRSLARLHGVAAGRVLLDGRPVETLRPREFARAVTLFSQSRPSPDGLTVREVVSFGRHPHRRAFAGPTAADIRAVEDALATTGLTDKADRPAGQLSGGEMQRVWLATCLAQDTDVLLLDESTTHSRWRTLSCSCTGVGSSPPGRRWTSSPPRTSAPPTASPSTSVWTRGPDACASTRSAGTPTPRCRPAEPSPERTPHDHPPA